MKILTAISLFIFWAIVVAILIAGLVFYQNSKTTTPLTPVNSSSTPELSLTLQEISKHNTQNNCWLLISGKVYNVTSYINSHPGGAQEIISSCGTDATQAYDTKGGRGKPHSSNANNILQNYYIGNLNQTTSQQNINNTKNITSTRSQREEEND